MKDRAAWRAAIQGVTKGRTQLSDGTTTTERFFTDDLGHPSEIAYGGG